MIKVQELRIGNYVCYQDEINVIYGITKEGFIQYEKENSVYYCGIDEIKPIELTQEILLKCGFVKCGVMADLILNISYNRILCYNNDQETINVAQHTGGFKNLRDVHLNKIKHLHQLQNIYFSLTGEELEIKL